MDRAKLFKHAGDRISLRAGLPAPRIRWLMAALFPKHSASPARAQQNWPNAIDSKTIFQIADVAFGSSAAAMGDHEENRPIVSLP
jgi:hypothetical protein